MVAQRRISGAARRRSTDGDRLAVQRGVVTLLDTGKKGIDVDVQDLAGRWQVGIGHARDR